MVFMQNYADGGGSADSIVEIQEVKPSEKDYPWNCSDSQGVGMKPEVAHSRTRYNDSCAERNVKPEVTHGGTRHT